MNRCNGPIDDHRPRRSGQLQLLTFFASGRPYRVGRPAGSALTAGPPPKAPWLSSPCPPPSRVDRLYVSGQRASASTPTIPKARGCMSLQRYSPVIPGLRRAQRLVVPIIGWCAVREGRSFTMRKARVRPPGGMPPEQIAKADGPSHAGSSERSGSFRAAWSVGPREAGHTVIPA